MGDWTEEDLLKLADAIGGRIEAGVLPAQDEHGRYMFAEADLRFPEVSRG